MDALSRYLNKLALVLGYAAARSAERVRRAHYYRVANLFGEAYRVLDRVDYFAFDHRLVGALHEPLEAVSVLALFYRFYRRAYYLYSVFIERTVIVQFAGEVEPRLTAHARDYAVRPLLLYYLFQIFDRKRLDICIVGHILIGHYSRGVAVYQHDLDAVLAQGLTSLSAGIIELRGLPYNYRSRTYYQDLFYISIFWHYFVPFQRRD